MGKRRDSQGLREEREEKVEREGKGN